MTITTLTDVPSINDPTNFEEEAEAFFVTQLPRLVIEVNAATLAMNLNSTSDTSASSVAIGTGAKSFTVSASKSFLGGMFLVIADDAAPSTNWMFGQVTSYSGTALVMNITAVGGSGTKAAWTISQSAAGTAAGAVVAGLGANTFTGDQTMTAASIIEAEGAAVASASSCNVWATDGNTVHVTGTTTINDFAAAPQAGAWMKVIFDGALTLAQSANLNLNGGGANIITEAGDVALIYADTTTQMDVFVIRKSGQPIVTTGIAKAWCYVTVSGGVPTLAAGFNVTSITDNGVGDYTVNLTTAFSSANFCAQVTAGISSRALIAQTINAAGSVQVLISNDNAVAIDANFSFVAFGAQ